MACELCAVVSDELVGYSEASDDILEELDRGVLVDLCDGFCLGPLGEFIDGDVEEAVSSRCRRKRSYNVQTPHSQWPG